MPEQSTGDIVRAGLRAAFLVGAAVGLIAGVSLTLAAVTVLEAMR